MADDLVRTAVDSARAAGRVLLEHSQPGQELRVRAKGTFDFVTAADLAAQEKIIELIHRRFPEDGILAEEAAVYPENSGRRWIIDPLDGTTNYIHKFPVFAVSIAVEENGRVEAGVVYDPCRDELFVARRGRGAMLNGAPLQVSRRTHPKDALVATGFPFRDKSLVDRYVECFGQILRQVSDLRRAGSAALDLAYVASGRCDGFWEIGLKPWDIAAGHLLIQEAGGRISDFTGRDDHIWVGDVVAGNPEIHRFLLTSVQAGFGGNVSPPSRAQR